MESRFSLLRLDQSAESPRERAREADPAYPRTPAQDGELSDACGLVRDG